MDINSSIIFSLIQIVFLQAAMCWVKLFSLHSQQPFFNIPVADTTNFLLTEEDLPVFWIRRKVDGASEAALLALDDEEVEPDEEDVTEEGGTLGLFVGYWRGISG